MQSAARLAALDRYRKGRPNPKRERCSGPPEAQPQKACRLVALSANLFIARRALEMGKDDVLIPWDDPEQIPIPEGVRGDDSSSEDEPAGFD